MPRRCFPCTCDVSTAPLTLYGHFRCLGITRHPPPNSATVYPPSHCSFTFIITFVFLNLFIGVILDGFDTAKEEAEGFITQEDFSRFADHWANFDPDATYLMSVTVRLVIVVAPVGVLV